MFVDFTGFLHGPGPLMVPQGPRRSLLGLLSLSDTRSEGHMQSNTPPRAFPLDTFLRQRKGSLASSCHSV